MPAAELDYLPDQQRSRKCTLSYARYLSEKYEGHDDGYQHQRNVKCDFHVSEFPVKNFTNRQHQSFARYDDEIGSNLKAYADTYEHNPYQTENPLPGVAVIGQPLYTEYRYVRKGAEYQRHDKLR